MTSLEIVTVTKYVIINSELCATVSFDINNYLFLLFLEIITGVVLMIFSKLKINSLTFIFHRCFQ